MSRLDTRIVLGALLIIAGLSFLAQSLGFIPNGWGALWAAVLFVAGIVLVAWPFADRRQWWAAIPGLALLGLAGAIFLSMVLPADRGEVAGAVFLGAVGLGFIVVYFLRRDFWWALIPAGVLMTLAGVTWSASFLSGLESGALFFLGLGLTFGVVALIPTPHGRMSWAWIPAGILGLMGVLIMLALGSLLNYVWPVALIAAGVYLLVRSFLLKRS
ncbi:MAG: hypothetical protein RMN25_11550 [Anaerolineae bacterium]|nr:hypothetical protein [Thermoflexales bacterium]MDW8408404.1 hypothetical protein [Anaerolineae bacterium]